MTDIRTLTYEELEQFIFSINEKKFRAKQVWTWLWKKGAGSYDEMTDLSLALRAQLAEHFTFQRAVIDQEVHSRDKSAKFAFRLHDDRMVEGVLIKLTQCVPELLAQGQPVKLDGLGTFYPTAQNKPGGLESIEEAKTIAPTAQVEGVHIRFTPEGEMLDNITSKAFKEKCALVWGDEIEITGYKDAQKKKGPIYKKTPISNPIVEPEPEP